MNPGSDPERDDFGLPPVDIEIPDDARELDRDVQAYRRELRALRRRMAVRRLHAPLTRDGMVLPLVAGCLALAIIAGTLLTLFSAGQADVPELPARTAVGPAATGRPSASTPSASAARTVGQIGGPLPDTTIIVGGRNLSLRKLMPAVIALVPLRCQCAGAVRDLATQAAVARVPLYLVGTDGAMIQLGKLAASAGQGSARVADDVQNVLSPTYQGSGLTAILVHSDGSVAQVMAGLQAGLRLTPEFMRLDPARR